MVHENYDVMMLNLQNNLVTIFLHEDFRLFMLSKAKIP